MNVHDIIHGYPLIMISKGSDPQMNVLLVYIQFPLQFSCLVSIRFASFDAPGHLVPPWRNRGPVITLRFYIKPLLFLFAAGLTGARTLPLILTWASASAHCPSLQHFISGTNTFAFQPAPPFTTLVGWFHFSTLAFHSSAAPLCPYVTFLGYGLASLYTIQSPAFLAPCFNSC